MSAGRLVAAGFAAGVVNLVLGLSFAHLVGIEEFQSILREHGLRVIGQPSDAIPHTIVRLLIGLVVTLLYAMLAPRFGANFRAALAAAAFGWALLYAHSAWGHVHIGLFPLKFGVRVAAWGLFEMVVTALAGGYAATGRSFWSR